jgi:hypothetical protein
VVALASGARVDAAERRGVSWTWTAGAVAVLAVGLGVRALLGGAGVGDRSAMVMSVLLSVGAWVAARVLAGPRVAFCVTLVVVALLDVAALPQRDPPAYDDLQAFYRTDQMLATQVAVPASVGGDAALTLVAQPTFAGSQPRFGLSGTVNGVALSWTCAFERRIQTLGLPLPAGTLQPGQPADVQLHLTGEPSREREYLVAYASSQRGGFLISAVPAAGLDASMTRCALA